MEPLHITEFASPRYFDKLRSLNEGAEGANDNALAETASGSSQTQTLTLPIREHHAQRRRRSDDNVRPSDQKRRVVGHDPIPLRADRRPSFVSFKFKNPLAHKVQATDAVHDDFVVVHRTRRAR
jgi:hypothetical protein